jgi:hypothetical protein
VAVAAAAAAAAAVVQMHAMACVWGVGGVLVLIGRVHRPHINQVDLCLAKYKESHILPGTN